MFLAAFLCVLVSLWFIPLKHILQRQLHDSRIGGTPTTFILPPETVEFGASVYMKTSGAARARPVMVDGRHHHSDSGVMKASWTNRDLRGILTHQDE